MRRLRDLIEELEDCLAEAEGEGVQPKEGDILYSSWGYDQTNIDFYKVLKVTKSSVKIQKVPNKVVKSGGPTDTVVPNLSAAPEGKVMTKRFRPASQGYMVKIESYSRAYLWDGQPKHQTGFGYGH